jgi:hypothetical protein
MPKRISTPKPRKKRTIEEPDVNQVAFRTVQQSIANLDETVNITPMAVSRFMAEMGRRGGRIGGKRRMETMTADERKAAASRAAKARWNIPKK